MREDCVGCVCTTCQGCNTECLNCANGIKIVNVCPCIKPIDNTPLQQMFDKQKILQKRLFDIELPAMMPERIPMTVTSIVAEIGEILETQQAWKDWKKNPKPVDYENLDTEIADIWHFMINLTMYLGYDAKDVFRAFMKKNKTNHVRQDNNY